MGRGRWGGQVEEFVRAVAPKVYRVREILELQVR